MDKKDKVDKTPRVGWIRLSLVKTPVGGRPFTWRMDYPPTDSPTPPDPSEYASAERPTERTKFVML